MAKKIFKDGYEWGYTYSTNERFKNWQDAFYHLLYKTDKEWWFRTLTDEDLYSFESGFEHGWSDGVHGIYDIYRYGK